MNFLQLIQERLNCKLKKSPKNYERSYNDGIATALSVVEEFENRYANKLAMWNNKEFAYKGLQEELTKKLVKLPTNKQQAFNTGILTAKSIVKDVFEKENEL